MLYWVTCQKWLEVVTKKEISQLGYKCWWANTFITVDGDEAAMARINLRSRCANKVYIIVWQGSASDFDELFELVGSIDWSRYHIQWSHISITAISHESKLTSTPAIQSVAQKAIFKQLQAVYNQTDSLEFDDNLAELEVRILIQKDEAMIMINTSWQTLSKRWYRTQSVTAPINESLAAAMIYQTGWKFSDLFLDPFCGSGTIAIEAAMIAKRVAPWLGRGFYFENWKWYDEKYLADAVADARTKIITDKKYNIYASDLDLKAIQIAENNAARAGVEDTITRIHKDIKHRRDNNLLNGNFTIVTNPPYWYRMSDISDIGWLYHDLIYICDSSITSSIITSWEGINKCIWHKRWSTDIYNWWIECKIYRKK